MAWRETDVRSERIRFVVEARQGRESISELCRRYGVSRKTGYKWLRRYEEVGSLSALDELSRRPDRSPNQTPSEQVRRVIALRGQYGWGSRKLRKLLAGEGIELARSTIDRILRREGLLGERTRSRPAVRRFERARPNELVQMDFKGHFPVVDGVLHPLSLLDDHSRFGLALAPLRSQETTGVTKAVTGAFERYGVPDSILIDHGTPWWSSTSGHGLTRFAVFLIRQGIELIYSGIAHPQTQGKVERFHRTLEAWLHHHGNPTTFEGFVSALNDFLCEYNEVRPHEALDLDTPAERYSPSSKSFQPNPRPWVYPSGTDVRRLADNGCLYLNGRYYFVCHALANRHVRTDDFDQRVLVSYRHMLIREIDRTTGRSRSIVEPYGPTGH